MENLYVFTKKAIFIRKYLHKISILFLFLRKSWLSSTTIHSTIITIITIIIVLKISGHNSSPALSAGE